VCENLLAPYCILALPCREGKESVAKKFLQADPETWSGGKWPSRYRQPTETLQQPSWAIILKRFSGSGFVESFAMMLPLSANSVPHDSALILPERQARWPAIKPHDAGSRPI